MNESGNGVAQGCGLLMVMDSAYPVAGGGGAESQAGTLGRWFNANGHACTLVVPMLESGSRVDAEVLDGLPVVRIRYPHVRLLGALVLNFRLARLLASRRATTTVIYAHIGSWMAAVCCLMGRVLHVPVIVKMTGQTELVDGVLDPRAGLTGRVKRALLGLATGYQATSSEIALAIEAVGLPAQRTHRIANAVQMDRFSADGHDGVMRESLCPGAGFVALFIGRLEPVKALDVLLSAWADALGGDRGAWLVLAGGGREEDALRAQAQALGIADRVVFAGCVDSVETYTVWADIAVLPSWREGLSNAMLECMAAGLPVLGSRVSGTEDFVIEGRTGWLFDAGDRAGLGRRLRELREAGPPTWQALGNGARAEIAARASLVAVTTQLIGVFEADRGRVDRNRRRRCAAS